MILKSEGVITIDESNYTGGHLEPVSLFPGDRYG